MGASCIAVKRVVAQLCRTLQVVSLGLMGGCISYDPYQPIATEEASLVGAPAQYGRFGFVFSASGGGTRAANYALGSLLALDSIAVDGQSTLLNELDYISTVSGGGLGAAVLVAEQLEEKRCGNSSTPAPLYYLLKSESGAERLELLRKSWSGAFLSKFNPSTWTKSRVNTDLFEVKYFQKVIGLECEEGSTLTLSEVQKFEFGVPYHIPIAILFHVQ